MENSGGSRGKGECPSRLRKRLRQALASSDWPIKRPKRDRRRQRGLEGSNVGPHPMPSHSHSLPPMLKVSLYFPPLAYPLYELMPIPPARPLRELKRSLADLSTGSLHAPDISFWLGDRLCGDDELVGELWAQQRPQERPHWTVLCLRVMLPRRPSPTPSLFSPTSPLQYAYFLPPPAASPPPQRLGPVDLRRRPVLPFPPAPAQPHPLQRIPQPPLA